MSTWPVRIDPEERFFNSIDILDNGCWQWLMNLVPHGYGSFSIRATPFPAHRFSYWMFKGDIPEGLHIDHLCRNRGCVNPEHLEAVTPRENILRGEGAAAMAFRSTSCPQGHPYDRKNNRGNRLCSICFYTDQRKYRRKQQLQRKISQFAL